MFVIIIALYLVLIDGLQVPPVNRYAQGGPVNSVQTQEKISDVQSSPANVNPPILKNNVVVAPNALQDPAVQVGRNDGDIAYSGGAGNAKQIPEFQNSVTIATKLPQEESVKLINELQNQRQNENLAVRNKIRNKSDASRSDNIAENNNGSEDSEEFKEGSNKEFNLDHKITDLESFKKVSGSNLYEDANTVVTKLNEYYNGLALNALDNKHKDKSVFSVLAYFFLKFATIYTTDNETNEGVYQKALNELQETNNYNAVQYASPVRRILNIVRTATDSVSEAIVNACDETVNGLNCQTRVYKLLSDYERDCKDIWIYYNLFNEIATFLKNGYPVELKDAVDDNVTDEKEAPVNAASTKGQEPKSDQNLAMRRAGINIQEPKTSGPSAVTVRNPNVNVRVRRLAQIQAAQKNTIKESIVVANANSSQTKSNGNASVLNETKFVSNKSDDVPTLDNRIIPGFTKGNSIKPRNSMIENKIKKSNIEGKSNPKRVDDKLFNLIVNYYLNEESTQTYLAAFLDDLARLYGIFLEAEQYLVNNSCQLLNLI